MAPPGTITLINNKPSNIGMWEPHVQEVWYVRPIDEPLHMPYIVHTQYGIGTSLQHDITLPKEYNHAKYTPIVCGHKTGGISHSSTPTPNKLHPNPTTLEQANRGTIPYRSNLKHRSSTNSHTPPIATTEGGSMA